MPAVITNILWQGIRLSFGTKTKLVSCAAGINRAFINLINDPGVSWILDKNANVALASIEIFVQPK